MHQWRLMKISTIEKTFYVLLWLPWTPRNALARYATIGNCPSCFDHQKMGFLFLPKAHQMCKSKTTHVKLAFPHIMRKKNSYWNVLSVTTNYKDEIKCPHDVLKIIKKHLLVLNNFPSHILPFQNTLNTWIYTMLVKYTCRDMNMKQCITNCLNNCPSLWWRNLVGWNFWLAIVTHDDKNLIS